MIPSPLGPPSSLHGVNTYGVEIGKNHGIHSSSREYEKLCTLKIIII